MLSHCALVLALAAFASFGSIVEADAARLESQRTTAASYEWAHGASCPHVCVHAIDATERTSSCGVAEADEAPDAAGMAATLLGLAPPQRSSIPCARSATERAQLVVSAWLARGPPQHVER